MADSMLRTALVSTHPTHPRHAPTALLLPVMAGLLERMRRAARPPFHALGVAQAREACLAGAEVLDLPPWAAQAANHHRRP